VVIDGVEGEVVAPHIQRRLAHDVENRPDSTRRGDVYFCRRGQVLSGKVPTACAFINREKATTLRGENTALTFVGIIDA